MAEASENRDRLLDAALALAASHGWRAVTLNGIASEAGAPLSRVHAAFPSKWAILDAFVDRIDEAVLSRPAPAGEEPARDRLFDVLMRRVRKRSNRPLLQTADPEATVRKLMDERYPVYALADARVHSRDVAHEVVVDEALAALDAFLAAHEARAD